MKKIVTVCGEISPDEIGITTFHDHTLIDQSYRHKNIKSRIGALPPKDELTLIPEHMHYLRNMGFYYVDEFWCVEDTEYVLREVEYFAHAGGNTIVDAGSSDIRGNVMDIRYISNVSNINIICSTGLYTEENRPPKYMEMSESEMYDFFMREIIQGIDGTPIKPGQVKCAISAVDQDGMIVKCEQDSVRAAARAAAESGLCLQMHTEATLPREQIEFAIRLALDQGLSPEKLVINHLDVNLSIQSLPDYVSGLNGDLPGLPFIEKVLQRGINVSFDTFGNLIGADCGAKVTNDFERFKALSLLLEEGFEDQLLLGHDNIVSARGVQAGLDGYTRIPLFVLPSLKAIGATDSQISKMSSLNAGNILSF